MNENRKALIGFLVLAIIGILMFLYLPKKNPGYRQSRLLLDTYVSIMVNAPREKAQPAVKAAFDRMSQIEKKLNRYDTKSEITRINKAAPRPAAVSDDTFRAVKLSLDYARLTEGKFDITVGPVVSLLNFNKRKVPPKSKIMKAKRLVDWRLVELDNRRKSVALAKKGMRLDMGGVAKGFAADEAYKVLRKFGIKKGLIDTGSSTLTFNPENTSRKWRIGIRHPRQDSILSVFEVSNRNVSTSGDYQQYFIKSGRRYHHIIDPQTGRPAKGLISVTIVTERTAAESDILSTAVFALGPEAGFKLVKSLKDTEAVLIDSRGRVKITDKKMAKLPAKIDIK